MTMNNITRPVFDAHFHIGTWGTWEFFGEPVTPLGPADPDAYAPGSEHHGAAECARYMADNGIQRGVVVCNFLAPEPRYSLIDLNKVELDAARSVDGLYAGVFVSPLPAEWKYVQEALEWVNEPGVKALKMTSTHWAPVSVDPATWDADVRRNMETILQVARRRNLPIQFHTGHLNSMPDAFDAFLREYGTNHIVHLVHSGETVYPGFQFASLFPKWLEAGYDVYCDTSMCPLFVLSWLLRQVADSPEGRSRILFATDSPWSDFMPEYWKIESLRIPEEWKQAMLWDNAVRLYEGIAAVS